MRHSLALLACCSLLALGTTGCKEKGKPAPSSKKVNPGAKAPAPPKKAAAKPAGKKAEAKPAEKKAEAKPAEKTEARAGSETKTAVASDKPAEKPKMEVKDAPAPGVTDKAVVGKPAPEFELKDLTGKAHKLSSFKGKTVVIEWYNPDCPFVVKAHKKGVLIDMAKKMTDKGVVWLAINSGAPGKQGHGVERNKKSLEEYKLSHPILVDEDGKVGKVYEAKTTPHMYIIDKDGVLQYRGALDTSGRGPAQGEEGYKNYTQMALDEVMAGKKVTISETKSWGCSVKYAM